MNRTLTLILAAAVVVALAPLGAAQVYEQLGYESFDYAAGSNLGDLGGGTGWSGTWWSGNTKDEGVVTSPGFDAVGEKMTVNAENGASYRLFNLWGMDPYLDQGAFGADGTTIWYSFQVQRAVGSDHNYGGLTLNWQWNSEALFVGSPFGGLEWGVEIPWVTGPTWILGTSCDTLATLVTRIDFLPGDERVQVWVDPGVDHPTTPAALDLMFPDMRFNEIRLQSGSGMVTGFDFDNIKFEVEALRPQYSATGVVAGGMATLSVSNLTPHTPTIIGYSVTGGGPTPTPFGLASMSMPIFQLPTQIANANGEVTVTVPVPTAMAGRVVWGQAADITASVLSNPVEVSVL